MRSRIEYLFGFDQQSFNGLLCDLDEPSVHTSIKDDTLFVLYFDGDMGCALFFSGNKPVEEVGLRLELIDCTWCNFKIQDMIFIEKLFKSFQREVDNVH